MRSIFASFGAIGMLVALLGCAGLPAPSDQQSTVAVLPVGIDTKTAQDVFGRYALKIISIDDPQLSVEVVPDPFENFRLITNLPAGSYKISQVRFAYSQDLSSGSSRSTNVQFTTHKGQITIINKQFQYRARRRARRT